MAGDDITVTGAASLAEAQTIAKNFSATKLALSEVSLELKKFALHSLKTKIDLENFKAEYEGNSYEVGHLQGPLLVTSAADVQFSGGLQIENFGYADSQTSIKKVLAQLNNIKGQVSAKGDVVIDLDLEARGMQLNDPAIEIQSVESVSAPLRVRIPAGSGYSVAGPVAIHNGVMTLSERELKKVSATVTISLSGALMDFRSTNLSAESWGQALKGTTHFAMTNDKYQISDTVFNLGDGDLSVKLSLGRKDQKPVSLNVTVKDLPMESAYRAIMQKDESPLRGKTTSLALQLTGNKKDLPASLAGSGSVQIDDFIFQTINIEQLFKDALASIPLVGPDLVPSDDVQLDKDGDLTASISIAESVVSIPDLKIQLSNFTIESSLQLGFDSIVKGNASVVLLEQTFRLLGFGFERLGSFLAREGRIAIPLLITGAITSPSVRPDIEAIAKFATGIDLIESVVSGVEEVADEL